MSRIIKIQSLKNGSSVIKIKTIANEKYIITDETGKPLNKLKFVQKNKNLEIYTEVDGKEQQIVTLEDYYAPDMNASVVGLSETSEELAYVYNANDGWSYLELPETAFGFATPLLGLGAAGAAGAGVAIANNDGGNDGNGSNTSSDTTPPATPTTAISNYDDNVGTITNANSTATTTDDTTPGFNVGAIPSDASSIVLYVNGVEVAATYNSTTGTLTPNTPLGEGMHSITYAYKDSTGNTSAQSPAFSLTVDTPPVAPATAISNYDDNVGAITNTNSIATTTDDTTPGFNVGAIPSDASSIVLYVDGVEVAATYDALNETLTPNTPLTEGTHSITYAYKDSTGNTSAQSPAFSLTVDAIPTATVALDKTALKIGETATLTITFSEVPSNFVEADDLTLENGTLSGGSFDVTGKIYTATFTPTANIEDSSNVITLGTSWNDSSNNAPASTSVSGNVSIDTIAPATLSLTLNTDTGINSKDGYTSNGLVDVTGIEVGNTWKYSIDGGTTWIDGVGSSFILPDDTYGANDIQVKQIDVSGNEVITSEVQGNGSSAVKLDGIPIGSDSTPQITTLSDGSYVVTWNGTDTNGDNSIFVQKFNADGTTTGNTQVTLEGIPTGQDQQPQITALANGEYAVTWNGYTPDGSTNSIYVQKFNANGTTTGNTPVTLDGIPTGQDQSSQITTLSDGSYVVTWNGTDVDGKDSIFVQKFNADGTTSGNAQVTLEGIPTGYDQQPQITALANDEYVVTWFGYTPNWSSTSVYVQKFNADGTTTGNTPVTLDGIPTGQDQSSQITTLSDGSYVVTWQGTDVNGDQSIFVQKFNSNGTTTGNNPVTLEGIPTGYDQQPQITALANGEYAVTWNGYTPDWSANSVYVQKFNADGTTTGNTPVTLEGIPTGSDYTPQITALANGEYAVTWQGTDVNGDSSIFVQKFNADGTTTGNTSVALEGIPTGQDQNSQITALIDGSYVVTWNGQDTNGDMSIFVQKFDADGLPIKVNLTNITVDTDIPDTPIIDTIATDDIVNASEQTNSITGTCEAGAIVSLSIGGNTREATVTGTTWSYTLTGADITAMGQGAETITVTQTDQAGNTSVVPASKDITVDTTTPQFSDFTPGQSVIDLGLLGKLIAPVVVEGKTYYYWDRSGDGTTANGGSLNGGVDFIDHNTLDNLFKYDIYGNLNPGTDTTDTYRYATINDIKIALPTANGGNIFPQGYSPQNGTIATIGDTSSFDELLAIWDTYNGTGTGSWINGTPPNWFQSTYWSSTSSSNGHVGVDLTTGWSVNQSNSTLNFVAVELISSNLNILIAENTANTTVIFDANATDNGGANDVGITYSIIGGADASKFTINSAGEVRFVTSPDYENPTDVGGNNVYDIIIRATDIAGNSSNKNVAINVTNINEPTFSMSMTPSSGFVPAPTKLEAIGNGDDIFPEITTLSDGSYVVTWYGMDTNGSYSIFVQKFNANGTTTGNSIATLEGILNGEDTTPQITALANSEFVVTWSGQDTNGSYSIFVQKFNADGTTTGNTKVTLEGISGGNDQRTQITTLSDGSYVVTWEGRDTNGSNSIFVQKFNANGTTTGNSIVTLEGISSGQDTIPQITALANGEYAVTWRGADASFGTVVYVQKFNSDGTITGNPVVTHGGIGYNSMEPQIATLSDGSYVVTSHGNNMNIAILVQKFNADGTTTGNSMVTLNGFSTTWNEKSQITPLSDGSYAVTWTEFDTSWAFSSVYVQKFNVDGTITGNAMVKLEGVLNGNSVAPQIIGLDDGSYVVTYDGRDVNGDNSIFLQKFNANGTTSGNQVMLEPTGVTTGGDYTPKVTALVGGGYAVTWYGNDESGDNSVFVQQFDANGIPVNSTGATTGDLKITTTFTLNDFETMNGYKVTYTQGSLTVDGTTYATGSTVAQSTWETAVSNGTVILSGVNSTTYNLIVETIATDTQTGATVTLTDTKMGSGMVSPMMLDLDGNGVNTSSFDNGVIFDVNADGITEQTGWSDGKDGLLVLDLNKDGIINDGNELFGEGTTLANGSKAKDAFEALKQYDENGDDVIDVNDSIFSSLQIWIDANVDGKTNSGELYKLEDLNVKSLDLNSQNISSVDNGNIQGLVSNWTDTNDNSHEMVDVWFKTQEVSQNTISETSAWTTSTVSEVNNQSYAVYANTQIVIDEESKTQNII